MNNNKPKIVFIFGNGHSGSTLLDLTLGSSKDCFSVGELRQWDRYFSPHINPNDKLHKDYCTCGEHVLNCPFWSQIREKDNYELRNKPDRNVFKNIIRSFFTRKVNMHEPPLTYQYERIFREIQKQADTKYIIDSSKAYHNLYRYIYLHNLDYINLKVIAIRKKLPGVILSHKKLNYKTYSVYLTWIFNYTIALDFIRQNRIPYFFVEYENFCDHTDQYLNEICEFLEIEKPQKWKDKYHNLGGNPMRFTNFPPTEIKKDEKWKYELKPIEKYSYLLIDNIIRKLK